MILKERHLLYDSFVCIRKSWYRDHLTFDTLFAQILVKREKKKKRGGEQERN